MKVKSNRLVKLLAKISQSFSRYILFAKSILEVIIDRPMIFSCGTTLVAALYCGTLPLTH